MAIVKQSFVTLRASRNALDEVAFLLSGNGDFIAEEPKSGGKNVIRALDPAEINPYIALEERLRALEAEVAAICGKNGKAKKAPEKAELTHEKLIDYIDGSTERLSELMHTCESVKRALDEDEKLLEQLGHLKGVDIRLEELFAFDFFKIRIGYLPAENYEKMKFYIRNMKSVIFTPTSVEKDYVWGTYIVIARRKEEVDSAFAALGFKRIRISKRVKGNPEEAYAAFSEELDEIKEGYEKLEKELEEYAAEIHAELPMFMEELNRLSTVFELKRKAVINGDGFTLSGWMPKGKVEKLRLLFDGSKDVSINEETPSEAGIEPPVKLKNPAIFRPFESFVKMYGTPAYNEIDPTVFFAVTYGLFFGLMFGDVGQGLVLFLGGLALYLWKKIPLAGVISFVGVFATAFGFVYGSVFGNEELIPHIFAPHANINMTLFGAVGLGVIMIIVCGVLNIINGIKQKNVGKYLLSPNGFIGLAFYVCALCIALVMFDMLKLELPMTAIWVIAGVCALLLFVREPLEKLLEGKKDRLPKNIGASAAENFFELFEVVLSYVTNTISFIRVGAFALSHAGMMTVVYLLAQTPSGGHNPVILVIGNILVMGLEGMVVCIQVLRLEFYELFSRYYSGTGREIKNK